MTGLAVQILHLGWQAQALGWIKHVFNELGVVVVLSLQQNCSLRQYLGLAVDGHAIDLVIHCLGDQLIHAHMSESNGFDFLFGNLQSMVHPWFILYPCMSCC